MTKRLFFEATLCLGLKCERGRYGRLTRTLGSVNTNAIRVTERLTTKVATIASLRMR